MFIEFALLLLGWWFLYFLSNRNFRLAEISRSKDKLVDDLKGLYEWYQSEFDDKNHSASFIEARFVSQIVKIQLKAEQLNNYVRVDLVNSDKYIFKLRNFEVTEPCDDQEKEQMLISVNEIVYDFVEHIERAYENYLLDSSTFFRFLWLYRRPELLGTLISLFSVYLFFKIASTYICQG